ncbi:hypothetical protein D3C81_1117150 [compost metagenome]
MVDRIGDQQHEQAAMRRHQLAAEVHRQCPGQCPAGHAGRDHPQRVLGGKRDSPFGDEAQPQRQGRLARFTLALGKLASGQEAGDTQANRRHHAGGHGRRHRRIARRGQQPHREGIGGLVDRPAQVDAHHAAQQQAQEDGIGGTHAVEKMREPFQHRRHRLADHVNHHQAGEQAGQQRNDQDRLECLQAAGQARPAGNGLGAVAGEEAGDDTTDKTGAQGAGQQAADHAGRQPRAVSDGPGDIARQQRHHQLERSLAADLHQRRRQGARFFIGLDTEHER